MVRVLIAIVVMTARTARAVCGDRSMPRMIRYNPQFGRAARHTSGPVAQLGARMNGIHEVTGSIPVWSTNLSPPHGRLAPAFQHNRNAPLNEVA